MLHGKNKKRILCGLLALSMLFLLVPSARAAGLGTATVTPSGGVNLRSAPSTSGSVVTALDCGTVVDVIGWEAASDCAIWYKVTTKAGKTGYVRADLLSVSLNVQMKAKVIVGSSSSLNVRSGAGTGNTVIVSLAGGTVVAVLGFVNAQDGSVWYKLSCSAGIGYASAAYLELQPPEEPSGGTDPVDPPADPPETDDDSEEDPGTLTDFEELLKKENFPESYKAGLRALHELYPNWVFKALHTGLDWDYVVSMEYRDGYSNVENKQNPSSWKSVESWAYNWSTGTWYSKDGSNWVSASREIIAYYMDPRNFLQKSSVFQFLDQSFDAKSQTVAGVESILKGSFMDCVMPFETTLTYAQCIYDAGAEYGANPYVLAAKILTEQSRKGCALSNGTNGVYNFFNYGAYGATDSIVIARGLAYAAKQGWDTPKKSIYGGTAQYVSYYIASNQQTLYLERFNVGDTPSRLFTHQYCTNIYAEYSQGCILAGSYTEEMRGEALTFLIPVYENMPSSACVKPTGDGSPNMKLSSLSVSGCSLLPVFSTENLSYTVTVPAETRSVTITAKAQDSKASVSGTGTVTLSKSIQTVEVTVMAENGIRRIYEIQLIWEAKPGSDVRFSSAYEVSGDRIFVSAGETVSRLRSGLLEEGTVSVFRDEIDNRVLEDALATGDRVLLQDVEGSSYGVYVIIIPGDVNSDGAVTLKDVGDSFSFWNGQLELDDAQLEAADWNRDGVFDIQDTAALYIAAKQ